jgi:signal transduction histidine kinase
MPKLNIFLKLVLTVLVFGLLLNICVIIVFRLTTDDKPRKYLRDFMRKMEKSIVYDIGLPPDTLKAKQICDDLDIDMRFESPKVNWTSSEDVPHLGDLLLDPQTNDRFQKDESFIAPYKGKPYSIMRYPQGVFIIKPFEPGGMFKPERAIFMLIIFISVVIILLYFLLRRIFRPLKDLSLAVSEIGDGNYNVKVPVRTGDELGELAGSINDMTEKIRNSMKSKEQLLIDVSHELRSPLTRIKLGLEVDSPKEKIEEDVIEMEKMVTGLLENYRADSDFNNIKPEKTDIGELIQETIEEYDLPSRLRFTKPAKVLYVNADMDKLQVVFRNLIDNALKYSDSEVIISAEESSQDVIVTFSDTGIGIPHEDLKNIFEPFYRADRSRSRRTGGFGLGLSICKKIIDAHKGAIMIESSTGNGTKVIVKLRKSD